jgi:hypothetical protein
MTLREPQRPWCQGEACWPWSLDSLRSTSSAGRWNPVGTSRALRTTLARPRFPSEPLFFILLVVEARPGAMAGSGPMFICCCLVARNNRERERWTNGSDEIELVAMLLGDGVL